MCVCVCVRNVQATTISDVAEGGVEVTASTVVVRAFGTRVEVVVDPVRWWWWWRLCDLSSCCEWMACTWQLTASQP